MATAGPVGGNSDQGPPPGRRGDDEARWFLLMRRGLTKKCPRCGTGKLFRGWFRMVDRCPGCGLKFEREPGFFVGAYLINFATVIVLLFVICMAFVAARARDPEAAVAPFLVVGLLVGLVAPVFCYPFARTVWSAIDIGMTPIEPVEEAEAAAYVAATDPTSSDPS